jgi:hypothetical protein
VFEISCQLASASLKDDARDCSRLSCCAGNTQPTPALESDLPSQPRLSVGRVGLQVQPIIEPVLFNMLRRRIVESASRSSSRKSFDIACFAC